MKQLLAISAMLAMLAGCNLTGGANASRVVSGSVMVPDNTYWTWIKLGIFSGYTAGTYPDLDISAGGGGTGDYRVYYSLLNNGTAKAVQPVGGTSYIITGSGDTLRDYTFELPSTVPAASDYYYYAAWYDGDNDDFLDLVDSSSFAVIPNGEYNRCATKATTNTAGDPTVITISHFMASGWTSGSYKYIGWDEAAVPYNEQKDLDTSTDSGFDFQISNNSGW